MGDPCGGAAIWTARKRDGAVDCKCAASAGGRAGIVWAGPIGLEDEEAVIGRKGSAGDVGVYSGGGWEGILQCDRQGSHVRADGLNVGDGSSSGFVAQTGAWGRRASDLRGVSGFYIFSLTGDGCCMCKVAYIIDGTP